MTVATHTQDKIEWSLTPAQDHTQERIYSGRKETVLLTVTILNPVPPAGTSKVEMLVNGNPAPNGLLNKRNAVTSRTWLLTGVKTIDLVARSKNYSSGEYAVSVLVDAL
jgi:hypothetical protein